MTTPCISVLEWMSDEIVSAAADTPLLELARKLGEHHVRHIPVLGSDGRLRGLVSNRDMLVAHESRGNVDGQRLTAHIMSVDLVTVGPEACIMESGQLLLEKQVGCLPVVDSEGMLLGILSESDFIRMMLKDHTCGDAQTSDPDDS
jgi:CBS-domain-containing membrane protein